MVRLVLVRHGQTPSNVHHLLDTAEPGASLTPWGEEQAAGLVTTLAQEHVCAVASSTLLRARQTARPLAEARGLVPSEHRDLREVAAGAFEMRGDEEAIGQYLETIFSWVAGDLEARIPGGENGVELLHRFDRGVAAVQAAAQKTCLADHSWAEDDQGQGLQSHHAAGGAERTIVIVTHGAVMRCWAAVRAQYGDVEQMRRPMDNTGTITMDASPAGWRLLDWNGEASVSGTAGEEPGAAGEELDSSGQPVEPTRTHGLAIGDRGAE